MHLSVIIAAVITLLWQIRAKEAQKIEAEMTRDPQDVKRRAMLQRLPELTRIARAYLLSLHTSAPVRDKPKQN